MTVAAVLLIAYLLGAIPFGLLVARVYGVPDIRRHGSGNIGATNVWRVVGRSAALWVYALDIAKGIGAVMIARAVPLAPEYRDLLLVGAGLAAVLGHVFSIYLGFRGGKGVNTALGVTLTLLPLQTLVAFVVFALVVAVWKFISLGSIVGAFTFVAVLVAQRLILSQQISTVYIVTGALLFVVIVITHRENIRRLIAGTESRFSLSARGSKRGTNG